MTTFNKVMIMMTMSDNEQSFGGVVVATNSQDRPFHASKPPIATHEVL